MMTWNCPAWVKVPFTEGSCSIWAVSAFAASTSTKRMRVIQWETA